MQKIKDDFARHFKNDDQFESSIGELKSQVNQLAVQLSQKQSQIESLKTELQDKIAQADEQDGQITKMKADNLAILQSQANKEIYQHNAAAQTEDTVQLAKQLIDLQAQENALLNEKNDLVAAGNAIFDKHVRMHTVIIRSRIQDLEDDLNGKQGQLELLKKGTQN